MYSYEWDTETGGLLLTSSPLAFSKEPRPVYYKELDLLGFGKYWSYEKQDEAPYLWAEANNYFYRGRKVAMTRGGSCYTAPSLVLLEEPEEGGAPLRPVDIPRMVEKNRGILESLAQETIKRVYNTYMEYKKKIDVFYVAFSGGKDSVVALDIVQRALPHNAFKVLFGDTGMEFPDTYDIVSTIEGECQKENIEFIRAKSVYDPHYTWRRFGPPATVTRWCCSVHKTAPQIMALRSVTGKSDFTGMAFIGIRSGESLARSGYDYISSGKKHRGQYSCNPILEWNSAELYLYIYLRDLLLNETYKKGNRRAGCLVCPRAAERNDWVSRSLYPKEYDKLLDIIRGFYQNGFASESALYDFIGNGGWKARKNGRDIPISVNYEELPGQKEEKIKVVNPKTAWREWIKTIGVLMSETSPYKILFRGEVLEFELQETQNEIAVVYSKELTKSHPLFIKLLKNVFRKVACCITCQECAADCHSGCIHMKDGKVHISDDCIHCSQCHKVEKGCLIYKSLEKPKGGYYMGRTQSLNCYSHHAPKMEWLKQYFMYKQEFDTKHALGSQMFDFFKRFLRDAGLRDKDGFTAFAEKIAQIGLDDTRSWGIMLVNLAYTVQVHWFIKNIPMNDRFSKEYTASRLVEDGAKESWVNDVWSSIGRLIDLPFGAIGLGNAEREKNRFVAITRTPWEDPEPLVILYALYKFAEACGDYYQFTLTRLLDHTVESDGVSPTEIFGLDWEVMEQILRGLSANHPDFINASFTLDLDNITLDREKSSADVLALF